MTVTTHNDERLTADEREELVSLKNAISYYPHAVSAQKDGTFYRIVCAVD